MKANAKLLKKSLRSNQFKGRLVCLLQLIALPPMYVYTALKDLFPDFINEFKEVLYLTFLPWEDDK